MQPPKLLLLLIAIVLVPTISPAQPAGADRSALMREFEEGYARRLGDFWEARFDSYKADLDRTLAPEELRALDTLRTRFSILTAFVNLAMHESEEAALGDTAMKGYVEYDTAGGTYETGMWEEPAIVDAMDTLLQNPMQDLEALQQNYIARQRIEDYRMLERRFLDTDDSMAVARPAIPLSSPGAYDITRMTDEMNDIKAVARWIARNHRPGIDTILERFRRDATLFADSTERYARNFFRTHRPDLEKDHRTIGIMIGVLFSGDYIRVASITDPYFIRDLEEAILLYGGEDVGELTAGEPNPIRFSRGIGGTSTEVLGAGTPDPASARTTIPFTLAEPATAVELRIADPHGRIVGTFPQGARRAGRHSATIDTGSLPPGRYLYQLKVTTAGGSRRIYSRTMDVRR